jgi:hypothetical protein
MNPPEAVGPSGRRTADGRGRSSLFEAKEKEGAASPIDHAPLDVRTAL